MDTKPSKLKWLAVATIAIVAIGLLKWTDPTSMLLGLVQDLKALGTAGAALYAGLYALLTVLLVPGTPLTLGAGMLYGPLLGSVVVSVGATVGATAAFILGRTLLRSRVEKWMSTNPRFARLDKALGEQGLRLLFLIRLSPVFPFSLTNFGMGVTRVSLSHYVIATFFGILPAVFVMVSVGSTLTEFSQLFSGPEGDSSTRLLSIAGLIATVIVTVLISRSASRALNQELNAPEEHP